MCFVILYLHGVIGFSPAEARICFRTAAFPVGGGGVRAKASTAGRRWFQQRGVLPEAGGKLEIFEQVGSPQAPTHTPAVAPAARPVTRRFSARWAATALPELAGVALT